MGDAEGEAAGERQRQRPQPGDDYRGQRAEHDQRELVVREFEQGGDEDTAEAREHHRQHPRNRGRSGGVDAAQAGQRVAIDDRAHLEPNSGTPQHVPEGEGRERGGDEDGELIGVQDGVVGENIRRERTDPGDLLTELLGPVAREPEVENVVADRDDQPLCDRGQRDQESDRPDDARVCRSL